MRIIFLLIVATVLSLSLSACSPEVGSKEWCKKMEAKPKGEWTGNEATAYAKNCIFRNN
ncbi:MAG: DUF3012 domain-containing protein [Gammaproteobacteria bacterium]